MQALLLIETPIYEKINVVQSANKVVFEAVLHTSDVPNRNGRIYTKRSMKQAIENIKERLQNRNFGGELDHPLPTQDEYASALRHITLSLQEMSHIFTKLWFDDNKLVGVGETLNTPNGKILAALLQDGVQVGFSLRAFTDELQKRGDYDVVDGPLSLVAIDAVATPSHSEATVQRILKLKEQELQNEKVKPLLESLFKNRKPKITFFGAVYSYEY